jgi:hypothetical protein
MLLSPHVPYQRGPLLTNEAAEVVISAGLRYSI